MTRIHRVEKTGHKVEIKELLAALESCRYYSSSHQGGWPLQDRWKAKSYLEEMDMANRFKPEDIQ